MVSPLSTSMRTWRGFDPERGSAERARAAGVVGPVPGPTVTLNFEPLATLFMRVPGPEEVGRVVTSRAAAN